MIKENLEIREINDTVILREQDVANRESEEILKDLGISNEAIEEASKDIDMFVGRVSSQYKDLYKIITRDGTISAQVSGKYIYETEDNLGYPAVGDYVLVDRTNDNKGIGIIHKLLQRKSMIARKSAGSNKKMQAIVSNVDIIFICMSLNSNFNISRLERYISLAWESGATPVIVLTKSDLCDDIDGLVSEVMKVSIGVEIIITSTYDEFGIEKIKELIKSRVTVAFIGSSGVGKSTLINYLLDQEIIDTQEIRNDDQGKHTTTNRELFILPNGGIVIDTPGMRELGVENIDTKLAFGDIEELVVKCKFNNCMHKTEPGCAVLKAIDNGTLSKDRLNRYNKLLRESKYQDLKQDKAKRKIENKSRSKVR